MYTVYSEISRAGYKKGITIFVQNKTFDGNGHGAWETVQKVQD